jgi:hypothetical protein
LDLRFIPDDVTFTLPPREVLPLTLPLSFSLSSPPLPPHIHSPITHHKQIAKDIPPNYKQPKWFTKVLQHTNIEFTWDTDSEHRKSLKKGKFHVKGCLSLGMSLGLLLGLSLGLSLGLWL